MREQAGISARPSEASYPVSVTRIVCSHWAERASVFGYSRPAVRKNAKFFSSGVDHRLDREDHAGLHDSAGAELAVMADLRIFVETDSDPVTAEFTNDAAALAASRQNAELHSRYRRNGRRDARFQCLSTWSRK